MDSSEAIKQVNKSIAGELPIEGAEDTKEKLEHFRDELIRYSELVNMLERGSVTKKEQTEFSTLRSKLWRKYGSLEQKIGQCPRLSRNMPYGREDYSLFEFALGPQRALSTKTDILQALEVAIGVVDKALGRLETTIPTSTIEVPQDSGEIANFLFDKMQLHPKVTEVSEKLFIDGHYAQAIEEAYKAVIEFVKEKASSYLDDRVDGTKLMGEVFQVDNPMIKLNKLLNQTDRSEQEGFKFLFMGATLGIRNRKAHGNVIMTDPYRTLEYLGFASMLMKKAEEGELVPAWEKQPKSKET